MPWAEDAGVRSSRDAITSATANDARRGYGDANPPLTGTLGGVSGSDNITASYTTTGVTTSTVGTYPITVTLNDPDGKLVNYDVTTSNGTLTITRAPLSIKTDATRFYGGPTTYTSTYNAFVNGETVSVLFAA